MSYQISNNQFYVQCVVLDTTNGSSYDISDCVEDVLVRKQFLEENFPLYVIDFRTTEEMRDIMRDHEIEISLRISMFSPGIEQSPEESDSSFIPESEKIFDEIIRIYDKPFSTTTSKKEDEGDDNVSQGESAPFIYYRVCGIPKSLIEKNEGTFNLVFKNCDLASALVYMISSVDKSSNVFIEKILNTKDYQDLLVPPMSLIPAIKFLDENYHHYYKNTAAIFYDDTGLYIYDPISTTNEGGNIIECKILDSDATENLESQSLPQVDENGNIKVRYFSVPPFVDQKYISEHILGSNTEFYYYDENFHLNTRNKTDETYKKYRYIWKYIADRSDDDSNLSSALSINLSGVNPKLITPITRLKLESTKYKDISGEYGPAVVQYGFMSNDHKHYTCSIAISTFKKSK